MRIALVTLLLGVVACAPPKPVMVQAIPHAAPAGTGVAVGAEVSTYGIGVRSTATLAPGVRLFGLGHRSAWFGVDDGPSDPKSVQTWGGGGLSLDLAQTSGADLDLVLEQTGGRVRAVGAEPDALAGCPDPDCEYALGTYRAPTARTSAGLLVRTRSHDLPGRAVVTLGVSARAGVVWAGEATFTPDEASGGGPQQTVPAMRSPTADLVVVLQTVTGRITAEGQVGTARVLGRDWRARYATDPVVLSVGVSVQL